ncbi:MAG: choice-of-anchor J domain-containing protein [Flavobacteriaceae bacterium]|nr:choice-of-anchor J domain-containing protein [Flavobacteriaceae bacterium]
MKKITLLAALFVAFAMNAQVTVWEDSFETYPDFEIDVIGDWTQLDNDATGTYGSADYDFLNEQYIGTGIVFNPSLATPDPNGTQTENADQNPNWAARTGDKLLYFIASTALLNDDYFMSPVIDLAGATGSNFSFWGKSVTDQYGLEQFEVLLSNTGNDPADFTINLSGGIEFAPIDVFTEFSYDLSAYDGQQIYIAIHYVAADSFIFQTDDYLVEAASLSVGDNQFEGFSHYVNADGLNLRANLPMDSVKLYNVLGQEVVSQKLANTTETVNISALQSGVYIATVSIDGASKTVKIVKK